MNPENLSNNEEDSHGDHEDSVPIFLLEVTDEGWQIIPYDEEDSLCASCMADVLQSIADQLREEEGEGDHDDGDEISLNE